MSRTSTCKGRSIECQAAILLSKRLKRLFDRLERGAIPPVVIGKRGKRYYVSLFTPLGGYLLLGHKAWDTLQLLRHHITPEEIADILRDKPRPPLAKHVILFTDRVYYYSGEWRARSLDDPVHALVAYLASSTLGLPWYKLYSIPLPCLAGLVYAALRGDCPYAQSEERSPHDTHNGNESRELVEPLIYLPLDVMLFRKSGWRIGGRRGGVYLDSLLLARGDYTSRYIPLLQWGDTKSCRLLVSELLILRAREKVILAINHTRMSKRFCEVLRRLGSLGTLITNPRVAKQLRKCPKVEVHEVDDDTWIRDKWRVIAHIGRLEDTLVNGKEYASYAREELNRGYSIFAVADLNPDELYKVFHDILYYCGRDRRVFAEVATRFSEEGLVAPLAPLDPLIAFEFGNLDLAVALSNVEKLKGCSLYRTLADMLRQEKRADPKALLGKAGREKANALLSFCNSLARRAIEGKLGNLTVISKNVLLTLCWEKLGFTIGMCSNGCYFNEEHRDIVHTVASWIFCNMPPYPFRVPLTPDSPDTSKLLTIMPLVSMRVLKEHLAFRVLLGHGLELNKINVVQGVALAPTIYAGLTKCKDAKIDCWILRLGYYTADATLGLPSITLYSLSSIGAAYILLFNEPLVIYTLLRSALDHISRKCGKSYCIVSTCLKDPH